MGVKGYKVFNSDWTCRGFQYEVGKTYTLDTEEEGELKLCNAGFHFCAKASDCFKYYNFDSNNHVAEIEALGKIKEDDDSTKCCTDVIKIVRELNWHEVLDLVNNGNNCTGLNNSGDYNSGNRNSGDCNSGNCNSGDCNSGDYNSGNCNSGDWNSGDYNSGNRNSGDCNSGNCNSGDWNKTCFSNGCFNTESPKFFLFDKPSDWTYQDWLNSDARYILIGCPSSGLAWVWDDDMTDEEKEQHPECSVTGGFLKHIEKETSRQAWWENLSKEDKNIILSIPNFDADIFKEITGVDVRKDS